MAGCVPDRTSSLALELDVRGCLAGLEVRECAALTRARLRFFPRILTGVRSIFSIGTLQ
jgi:hypothetical protein